MDFETISRRESRKRRRLSERRRLFSNRLSQMSITSSSNNGAAAAAAGDECQQPRSESPVGGDQRRISMKIQFHITVAPENEPLILEQALGFQQQTRPNHQSAKPPTSIGEQIQEKLNLSRQNSTNSSNTRARQQRLLAMHNSTNTTSGGSSAADTPLSQTVDDAEPASATLLAGADLVVAASEDNLLLERRGSRQADDDSPLTMPPMFGGREPGVRSSTITGGMADEATVRFLQRTGEQQQEDPETDRPPQRYSSAANLTTTATAATPTTTTASARERIYFKRDGQRFGHEFTLKLAVERTYRCLLKVRPLIPIQSISIQGHQMLFVDCSSGSSSSSTAGAASSSTGALNQRLRSGSAVLAAVPSRHSSQPVNDAYLNKHHSRNNHQHTFGLHQHPNHIHQHRNHHHHNHTNNNSYHNQAATNHLRGSAQSRGATAPAANRPALYHAQTTGSLYRGSQQQQQRPLQLAESASLLYSQQQNQMMRHFAATHRSPSSAHLGNQLIYMFDWPASRFEVNRNKNRTQVQTVLKFKNGQVLSLPLQVKFYQSECRQHLEWGSQLHFIDYDCQINQLGQISVDRIQYY